MDLRHQLLRNRYEIIEDLGGGGFGKVFKAIDSHTIFQLRSRPSNPSILENPEIIQLFEQEAKITSAFNDPHIVQVYDYFIEGNLYFILLEFVEGRIFISSCRNAGYELLEDVRTSQIEDYQEIVFNIKQNLSGIPKESSK